MVWLANPTHACPQTTSGETLIPKRASVAEDVHWHLQRPAVMIRWFNSSYISGLRSHLGCQTFCPYSAYRCLLHYRLSSSVHTRTKTLHFCFLYQHYKVWDRFLNGSSYISFFFLFLKMLPMGITKTMFLEWNVWIKTAENAGSSDGKGRKWIPLIHLTKKNWKKSLEFEMKKNVKSETV